MRNEGQIDFFKEDDVGFQTVRKKRKAPKVNQGSSRAKAGSSGGKKVRKIKYWKEDEDRQLIAVYEEVGSIVSEAKERVKVAEKERKESRNLPICISRENSKVVRNVLHKNGLEFKTDLAKKITRVAT